MHNVLNKCHKITSGLIYEDFYFRKVGGLKLLQETVNK